MQFIFFCHIVRDHLFDFVVYRKSLIRSAFKHEDLNTDYIQDNRNAKKKKNSKLHAPDTLRPNYSRLKGI